MHKETVACKAQLEQLQKALADKQKVLEDTMDARDRYLKQIYALHGEKTELEKVNKYWGGLVEQLQNENADLRWRRENSSLLEKQIARQCIDIVEKNKNDPLTRGECKRWMVAICEDIQREIKKEFGVK